MSVALITKPVLNLLDPAFDRLFYSYSGGVWSCLANINHNVLQDRSIITMVLQAEGGSPVCFRGR